MADVVAESGAAVVIMHNRARIDPDLDIRADSERFFDRSLALADRAGVARSRILLDPGIGFGKTKAQNLKALALIGALRAAFGLPILVGVSRKRLIERTVRRRRRRGAAHRHARGQSRRARARRGRFPRPRRSRARRRLQGVRGDRTGRVRRRQPAARRASILAAIAWPSSRFIAERGLSTADLAHHMRGPRRKHENPVGESDRLVDVVGDEHGDHGPAFDEPRQIALQLPGERRIERNERLVEQKKRRANGERARERPASREADREFAGKMAAMFGQAERGEQARRSPLRSASGAASRTLSSTLRHGKSRGS